MKDIKGNLFILRDVVFKKLGEMLHIILKAALQHEVPKLHILNTSIE